MTLRKVSTLIIIALAIGQPQLVRGQEDSDFLRQIEIKIWNNTTESEGGKILDRILTQTRSNLEAYGVLVEEIHTYDPFQTPFWNLSITLSDWEKNLIFRADVSRNQYPFTEQSPIITENYGGGASIVILSENQSQAIARAIEYTTAISLYSAGRCAEADPHLAKIIDRLDEEVNQSYDINYTLASMFFFQANCSIAEGDFDNAIQLLERSLRLSTFQEITLSTLRYSYYLAWTYLQIGQEDEALDLMKSIVEQTKLIPGSGDAYNDALLNSARIYALMSHYEDAIENLDIYLERFNYSIKGAFILRGQMYLNLYEWDNSLADFNTAIELDPDYAEAYFQRGVLYYSILQTGQELREEALADFRHYLELAPDGPYAEQAADYARTIEAELAALNE